MRTGPNVIDSKDIYTALGVKTIINGRGTWTYLGGARINPVVHRAMEQASLYTVDVLELQRVVGRRLAKLAGAEAAMVTCGAATAIAAGTAGCMTGIDSDKVYQLPDTSGMKNEVIAGNRSVWDSAIRLTGAHLVLAETPTKLCDAINEKTAMVYWSGGSRYSVERALEVCQRARVPLFVDVASSIPCKDPVDVFTKYAKMGVDLYAFSGGKGLCGPQTSGILIGRTNLIEAALANYSPWEGAICRPMKVGKEEIIGALVAVETYLKRDHKQDWENWEQISHRLANSIRTIAGVKTTVGLPKGNYRVPHCIIEWNSPDGAFSARECVQELREGDPAIEVHSQYNPSLLRARIILQQSRGHPPPQEDDAYWIAVCPIMLKPGEEQMIGDRLCEIFQRRLNT